MSSRELRSLGISGSPGLSCGRRKSASKLAEPKVRTRSMKASVEETEQESNGHTVPLIACPMTESLGDTTNSTFWQIKKTSRDVFCS